jgi:hypothetical protein
MFCLFYLDDLATFSHKMKTNGKEGSGKSDLNNREGGEAQIFLKLATTS